jgi:2-phosphosulfolactate phosphatase
MYGDGMFEPWPGCAVHVEWGSTGAQLAAAQGDIVVVVDVLSFSTTLTIAVARGCTCLVYSPAEIDQLGGLEAAAASLCVRPLSKDRRVSAGQLSLSPASLLAAEPGQRVLFTSLNGATVTAAAAGSPALLVGCLRNATATARAVARLLAAGAARRVTVVACAEQWTTVRREADGLRPAVEDWVGAGLISARLGDLGLTLSAEAQAAAAAACHGLEILRECVSARELHARGFAEDVTLALQVDSDDRVPTRIGDGRLFAADVQQARPARPRMGRAQ